MSKRGPLHRTLLCEEITGTVINGFHVSYDRLGFGFLESVYRRALAMELRGFGLTVPRRSLYFRSSKEKKMQFLAMFDSPNPVECYRRSESIAPQQALAMANSPLTLAQSRVLAKKLSDSLGNVAAEEAPKRFIEAAFVRILCRPPTEGELATCTEFLTEQAAKLADAKSLTAFSAGPAASVPPSTDPNQRARENLVHVLFNHNDFVTVR